MATASTDSCYGIWLLPVILSENKSLNIFALNKEVGMVPFGAAYWLIKAE